MARKPGGQRQTVQMLMSDRSMEIGVGIKVGSQLISDMLNGVAMPGRQMPTDTFIHKELNRAPHKADGVHFETENPMAVEMDSQFLQVDAWSMWDGARLDLDSERDGQRRFENILKGAACVMARFKSGILGGLMSLGVPLGIFGFLWWNDEFGWFWDIFFSLGFGFMLSIVVGVWRGYREAFRKVYVVERADFTDVGFVTALVRVWLPALGFYKRPEVWRGDNGRNGIGNPNAFVALSAGQDVITWHEMPEMDTPEWEEFLDRDVWCDVEPGPRVTEFRTPLDYFDLAPDVRTCDGISVKHRRAWCRDLQRSGQDFEAWRKGALGFLESNWPWFYAAGCAVVGVFILMLAM